MHKFEIFKVIHCEGNGTSNNDLNSRIRNGGRNEDDRISTITNNSGSNIGNRDSTSLVSSVNVGDNTTASNITINPNNNPNNNPPTMNVTRTVTTTESITTPANQSNSNLANPLLANNNNNGNPASPPRYSNNNSLNLLDKGKRIANEAVGIFTQEFRSGNIRTELPVKDVKVMFEFKCNKELIDTTDLEEELNIFNNILLGNEEEEIKELLTVANLEKLTFISKNPEIVINYEDSELESISSLIGDSESESNSSQSDILELPKDIQINKKKRINVMRYNILHKM
jgi:hypothetical protein